MDEENGDETNSNLVVQRGVHRRRGAAGAGAGADAAVKKPRGFATMTKERQLEIARRGGEMSTNKFKRGEARAREAGKKGGRATPTRFTTGDDRAKAAGRKGGAATRKHRGSSLV